jgi:hypothetical protein
MVKQSEFWKLFVTWADVPPFTTRGRSLAKRRATMTTKIALAFALAIAALASVPASASPHHDWQVAGNCQEDLGYGRTSGWGCG